MFSTIEIRSTPFRNNAVIAVGTSWNLSIGNEMSVSTYLGSKVGAQTLVSARTVCRIGTRIWGRSLQQRSDPEIPQCVCMCHRKSPSRFVHSQAYMST